MWLWDIQTYVGGVSGTGIVALRWRCEWHQKHAYHEAVLDKSSV